ncbi:adapter protein MecA [Bacillus glycinifermentans]|uniref:Adapter protein MecA n=1 Tax=Bacillus glycinifermentans TaxID=1664069 RepID=A0A0J6ENB2_9BACI|nr:adaptor protein MecA [Bacillus glycinifermentans]ATH95069.1 adaptor protein MecA [Bacillus glycinifermentans]KMM61996.1 adapter protein MecA [Bacillus glycinifermentans]KRT93261.1 adaptor protein MecA [Bacillus glycinifermentans]MEC0487556.1 adaptor protein MecA [Bacillus glycinifermentans]MEC0495838.1 adaptor protein MecA [Bacillus glycinifermentans]
MEIERINEHTVKFYISYGDIEDRGFDREEIWYNRERSEELFWEMMDEVHEEEEFAVEGPLWIQVQALDKGLEIIVTKAQLSKDGQKLELPIPEDKKHDPAEETLDALLEDFHKEEQTEEQKLQFVLRFNDFEDVISLSKVTISGCQTSLYTHENRYYLFVDFNEMPDKEIENQLSILLEYASESKMTIHMLKEYGTLITADHALDTINKYFS